MNKRQRFAVPFDFGYATLTSKIVSGSRRVNVASVNNLAIVSTFKRNVIDKHPRIALTTRIEVPSIRRVARSDEDKRLDTIGLQCQSITFVFVRVSGRGDVPTTGDGAGCGIELDDGWWGFLAKVNQSRSDGSTMVIKSKRTWAFLCQ